MSQQLKYSLFFIWLFHLLPSFGQVETVRLVKPKTLVPIINGVCQGEIPIFGLCDSIGIQNADYKVEQFKLQCNTPKGQQEFLVKGAAIPDSICAMIANYNMNNMIFITDIIAADEKNVKVILYSMHLTPVRND